MIGFVRKVPNDAAELSPPHNFRQMNSTSELILSAEIDAVNWTALSLIFALTPLGQRDPCVLERTFRNSGVFCFAYLGHHLIGAGRALTDRSSYAFITGIIVRPEHQRKGYGRRIMSHLVASSGAKNHVLYSVPEMQSFYAALGYRRMKTAMALFADPEYWHANGYIE